VPLEKKHKPVIVPASPARRIHKKGMSSERHLSSVAVAFAASLLVQCSGVEDTPAPAAGSGAGATGGVSAGMGGATGGTSAGSPAGGTAGSALGGTAGAGAAGAGGGAGNAAGGTSGFAGAGAGGLSGSGGAGAAGAGGAGAGAGGAGAGTSGSGGAAGASGAGGSAGAGAGGSAGTSGSSGSSPIGEFIIGADISEVDRQEKTGTNFVDNGSEQDILAILKARGFNWIRLRVFVDPRAQGGYSSQGYCDTANTVAMGARVKQAGLGFLLDFHYSDYWADPGKQIKPFAWRNISTIEALATQVQDYTRATIQAFVAGGARPDMVQIGNEITPGMLLHVPNDLNNPDGALTVTMPNGSIDNWPNLGLLLKAGVAGVKEVDSTIKIMLHTDRGGSAPSSTSFVEEAIAQDVPFDVFAVSCYVEYQGGPSACSQTLTAVLDANPNATFQVAIAEYAVDATNQASIDDSIRGTNEVVFDLPNERGAGTFFWEPTRYGAWGDGLFTFSGNNANATDAYMDYYDQMKVDFAR